jgi:hypothetical protein
MERVRMELNVAQKIEGALNDGSTTFLEGLEAGSELVAGVRAFVDLVHITVGSEAVITALNDLRAMVAEPEWSELEQRLAGLLCTQPPLAGHHPEEALELARFLRTSKEAFELIGLL